MQTTLSMLRSGAHDVCFRAFYFAVSALVNPSFIDGRSWGLRLLDHELFCSGCAAARPNMVATELAIDVDDQNLKPTKLAALYPLAALTHSRMCTGTHAFTPALGIPRLYRLQARFDTAMHAPHRSPGAGLISALQHQLTRYAAICCAARDCCAAVWLRIGRLRRHYWRGSGAGRVLHTEEQTGAPVSLVGFHRSFGVIDVKILNVY